MLFHKAETLFKGILQLTSWWVVSNSSWHRLHFSSSARFHVHSATWPQVGQVKWINHGLHTLQSTVLRPKHNTLSHILFYSKSLSRLFLHSEVQRASKVISAFFALLAGLPERVTWHILWSVLPIGRNALWTCGEIILARAMPTGKEIHCNFERDSLFIIYPRLHINFKRNK